jgi:hypothetical protein
MPRIAIIQSIPRQTDDGEAGVYESVVTVSFDKLVQSADPKGHCNHIIARHLAGCVEHTELPLHEGLWRVAFSHWAQKNLGYPGGFTI